MNKVNKTKIKYRAVYGLGILAILAFGIIFTPFSKAVAAPTYVSGHYNADGSYTFGDFVWPESKNVFNSNGNSNSNTNDNNSNNYYTNRTGNTNANNANNSNETVSTLASNAIFGSKGFLPSGLMQWILFAIIILILVILVRRFFGAKQYHSSPMKHA